LTTVEIMSAAPADFITEVSEKGISLYNIRFIDPFTFIAQLDQVNYLDLKHLAERRGNHVKVKFRSDWKLWIIGALRRPIILFGFVVIFLLTLYLPTRVFFFVVEGNATVLENDVMSRLEDIGITIGVARNEIRSEQIKNTLLNEIEQLQWVGVNTYGCVAVISVKERTILNELISETGVSSIVSDKDGIICDITVRQGMPMCTIGQAVKKGERLISGYTDCGISVKAERAAGDIFAYTRYDLTALYLENGAKRGSRGRQFVKYSLRIGKKLINLSKDSRNLGAECAKIYSEFCISLPGGFTLPIALVKETQTSYAYMTNPSETSQGVCLSTYIENYLYDHMIQGSIMGRWYTVEDIDECTGIVGRFFCREKIGREQNEEIIG